MQSSKVNMKRVEKEIEAAAVALGFPQRVSPERVESEAAALQRKNGGKTVVGSARDRYLALANLFLLVDETRNMPAKLLERSQLVRALVAKAVA